MTSLILSAPLWESYTNRKLTIHQDPNYFAPEELWEFNYLTALLVNAQPEVEEIVIILSIKKAMRKTLAPRPRQHFVQLVLKELYERETDWEQVLLAMKRNPGKI
ncbi:MAG: hypothetical protein ABI415_01175 [Flavitalea sp.]